MKKTLTLIKKMPIIISMVAAISATSVTSFAAENDYAICDNCHCYRPCVTVETRYVSITPCYGDDSSKVVEIQPDIQPVISIGLIEHLCEVCAK